MKTKSQNILRPSRASAGLSVVLYACSMIAGSAQAMIYKPGSGAFWDPSILYHEGKYYLFSMYRPDKGPNHHVWSAVSDDGVHWKDVGIVITSEGREVNDIWKPFIAKAGDRFILNHGALSKPGVQNQCVFGNQKTCAIGPNCT